MKETEKLRRAVKWIAVHLYPPHRDRIVTELEELGLPRLEVAKFGVPYVF
jgi:hypothetical protein